MIFKVDDYQNTTVILSRETWYKKLLHPVFGHPEVKPFLTQIKKTVENPNYIYQSIHDPRSKLFFTKIKSGMFAFYFLVVVVKYVKEQNKMVGYVSTVMINRKLPKAGNLIWEIKVLT